MVKTPTFEKPLVFGATTEKLPIEPGEIRITEGAEVDLRYQGKRAQIRVSKVLKPQAEFEGVVQSFENHEPEHGGLKYGDVVKFAHDDIEHIFKWVKEDQP